MAQNPKNWISIPYEPHLKEKARELRNNPTPAEKQFWYTLQKMPWAKAYRFNRQKPIGEYIVDFFCSELGLVIEIDGHTHGGPEAQAYDRKRTEFLESYGLRVIRFTNKEVLDKIEGVMTLLEGITQEKTLKSP